MQKDILFNSRLSDRDFGSYLLHVPSLLNWTESTGIHFPETNPQIDTYKFVQVEELLCAIERVFKSLTTEQALNILRSQPEHQLHPAVIHDDGQLARWLLGADAHLKWRKLIVASVKKGELKLLDFASKLPLSDKDAVGLLECLRDDNQSNTIATNSNDDAQIGEIVQAGDGVKHAPVTLTNQSSDEALAALFDEVHYRELATMFPTHIDPTESANDWKKFSGRNGRNGLIVAKVSVKRGMYNPYKAARWWIDERNPIGWDWSRCIRKLENSLPTRSKDEKHLLTGNFD